MNSKRPGDDLFEQFDQIMTVQRKIANVERAIHLIRGQRVMIDSESPKRREIGFHVRENAARYRVRQRSRIKNRNSGIA